MPKDRQTLIEFPCEFPIKIIGHGDSEFEGAVFAIARKHFPKLGEGAIALRPSKHKNYTAITLTVTAISQAQLDRLYEELSQHEKVVMVL